MKKVELQTIIDELQLRFIDSTSYYNKENGEIIIVSDEDISKVENSENEEELVSKCIGGEKEHLKEVFSLWNDEQNKYIALPGYFDINDSDIMEQFIDELENSNQKSQLYNCMWQKGMYRKFKDKLEVLGIEQKYYDFYEEKLKEIAIQWCKENNLEYE